LIVSVDGGCEGVRNVQSGVIGATSQQYPLKMAQLGVDAGVAYAKTGKKVSGYTDTGVTLITDKPMKGVDSKDTKFGLSACWGEQLSRFLPSSAPRGRAEKGGILGTQTAATARPHGGGSFAHM